MITIITTIGIVIISYLAWRLYKRSNLLQKELKQAESKIRSLYVKFGKSFEHFVPFIKNFPGDREKTSFLGMPIDFIIFDSDTIKFVEVKTGQSQLSPKQKFIKKQIENGQVEFKEVRF